MVDFIRGFFTTPLLMVLVFGIAYLLFPPVSPAERPLIFIGMFTFVFVFMIFVFTCVNVKQ